MSEVEAKGPLTEPNQETVERFFSAYAMFLEALQPAWARLGTEPEGASAYQEYAQALQEFMELEIRQRLTTTWRAYIGVVENTLSAEDMQAQSKEAYQNYLQSIQQAWAESDLKEINALTLASISQSITMASWIAATCSGVAARLSDGSVQ